MNFKQLFGQILLTIISIIIIFVIMRFVGQRNKYGYIGPDTSSLSYQSMMSGLSSRSNYLQGNSGSLDQAQSYFSRALQQNNDTLLANTLSHNLSQVTQRQQLETIKSCLTTITEIDMIWSDINSGYISTFELLEQQMILMPIVISKSTSKTLSCTKNYFDHIKQTIITLSEASRTWGNTQKSYINTINTYPSILGSCEQIIAIKQQSEDFKKKLQELQTQYKQYELVLSDPSRYQQLCSATSYTNTITLKPITHIGESIENIKKNMSQ